ncbi:glycine-rich cell wall structural protein 1.8-like [Chrysoperla carnea]|uniref:glycine-rich cell wall structural protein 1.8-like n=1 Tax=Chrysoperla carnea TaxID=189513 RepID=UPI001D096392|nr:glycine-rich cell wall structural protein 1.8-like [Chrysoperla carnea]
MKFLLCVGFIAALVTLPMTVKSENLVANSGVPLVPAGSIGSDGAHLSGFGGGIGVGKDGAYAGTSHTGQHHGRPYRSAENLVANSGVPLVPAGSIGSDGAHLSGFGGGIGVGKDGAYAGSSHTGQHHGRPYRSAENLVANSGVPLVPAGSIGSDGAHLSGFGGGIGVGKDGAYAGTSHTGQHHGRPYRSAENLVANSGVPLVPAGSIGSDGAHLSGFGGGIGVGKDGAYAGTSHTGQHHGRPYRSAENLVANSGVPLVPAGSIGSDGAHLSGFGGGIGVGKDGAYAGSSHTGQHHGRPY